MYERVVAVGGQPGGEPLDQPVVAGHLPCVRQLPLPLPSGKLPGQVSLRAPEPGQPGGGDVHAVDRREHLDQPVRELPRLGRREPLAILAGTQHHAVHEVHQVERRADDAGVVADGNRCRHRDVGAVQRGQHPELSGHVMGGRQHVPERRAPQHQPGTAKVNAVGEVRATACYQLDARQVAACYAVGAEPSGQLGTVNSWNVVNRHAGEHTARAGRGVTGRFH